jgi:phage-related protein (TIGR01555 family)
MTAIPIFRTRIGAVDRDGENNRCTGGRVDRRGRDSAREHGRLVVLSVNLFRRLFKSRPLPTIPAAPAAAPLTPWPLDLRAGAFDPLKGIGKGKPETPFTGLPKPPPGVRPDADPPKPGMAMDEGGDITTIGGVWGAWAISGLWGEGLRFPGYPYLSELSQRPEYRNITETIAEEMTRKWIKLLSTGTEEELEDKTDTIHQLEDAMKHYGLREVFNSALEKDGFLGMCLVYIDLFMPNGKDLVSDDPDELKTELIIDKAKITKGSLRGFVPIEPTWVSPKWYNSTDPLKSDYFRPSAWYVMGKETHESRLLIVRSREVPDLLKAAYNFGGLSLSQLSKPYVDNWIRTRQSVSDLLHSFTNFVLKTTMGALTQNAAAMLERIQGFVYGRDNAGVMLVDKESEDFANVSAPLGALDDLQAQAMEQMAFPAQEPLLKFVGYTPTGLNADTQDIIRSWYDRVKAKQEKVMGHHLTVALRIIQLSVVGEIDPEITFEFVNLWELDSAGRAAVDKIKADVDTVYMDGGVISNEEVRTRLAGDPDSPYHGLKGAPPPMPEETGEPSDEDDADRVGREGANSGEGGANSGV